ncbi:MAG: TraR/DksA C4-type zinc finger protein [Deltaproteobacteria bacterium]
MNSEQRENFRNLLLNEKDRFNNTIAKMNEHGSGEANNLSSTELSSYDNHPAELGTEVFNLGMNLNLKANETNQIKEIERALNKIDKGVFGQCEICKNEISTERLQVRPYVRLCINCENDQNNEKENIKKARPVEEQVIGSPFGKKYLNKQEDDEHEGLDYLNDLMKYGSASSPQDMGGYKDYKEFYTNEVDEQGSVDKMDKFSNSDYERQLPD